MKKKKHPEARAALESLSLDRDRSNREKREREVGARETRVKVLKRTLRFYERTEREDCANPSSPFPPRSASNHRLTKK